MEGGNLHHPGLGDRLRPPGRKADRPGGTLADIGDSTRRRDPQNGADPVGPSSAMSITTKKYAADFSH